ncbi:MAG: GyrI-like domain-containing protein [Planctomycetota bacterium JB042]
MEPPVPSRPSRAGDSSAARVDRAIDHVRGNLAEPLDLERLAHAAGLSACHFHRVFRARTGETPHAFVKRLRLEDALRRLAHGRPRSLTEVALASGFSSSSDFSRSFRQRFGVPPSRFDLEAWRRRRRDDLGRATPAGGLPDGAGDRFEVALRRWPAFTVAYLRVAAPYREGVVHAATTRLVEWAERRGVADGRWLGYQWDDPTVVALDDCRYDVAVDVTGRGVAPEAEVGTFDFPPMLVAEIEVSGPVALELRAIEWLHSDWFPRSGHVPADRPSFEVWAGRPFAHGLEHFEVTVAVPVERA